MVKRKCINLKYINCDFPEMEEIITSTSPNNFGMDAINKKLGYRYSHSDNDYKMRLA